MRSINLPKNVNPTPRRSRSPGHITLRPSFSRPGFTTTEILITMIVLALGGLAMFNLQKSIIDDNYQPHQLAIASLLAESQLELLKAGDFAELNEVKNSSFKLNRYGQTCQEETDRTCYELILNIEARPIFKSRLIRLEVRKSRRGQEIITLETAITDY